MMTGLLDHAATMIMADRALQIDLQILSKTQALQQGGTKIPRMLAPLLPVYGVMRSGQLTLKVVRNWSIMLKFSLTMEEIGFLEPKLR